MAVLSGELKLPNYEQDPRKYCQIRFRPPGWSWIDPTKEVQAYKEAVKAGFIRYIPFPESLKGKYQAYTQADLTKLRAAGCDVHFRSVEEGTANYVADLLTRYRDVSSDPTIAEAK